MLDNVLHSGVLWVFWRVCASLAEARGSCSGARGQGEGGLQKLGKFPGDVRIQIISKLLLLRVKLIQSPLLFSNLSYGIPGCA